MWLASNESGAPGHENRSSSAGGYGVAECSCGWQDMGEWDPAYTKGEWCNHIGRIKAEMAEVPR